MRARGYHAVAYVAVACFCMGSLLSGQGFAKQVKCARGMVTIDAPGKSESALACEGASDAVNFLISQGLRVPPTISIKVVNRMPAGLPAAALGAYLRTKQQVVVVSYAAFLARRDVFGLPLDQSLYRAVVAHEVSHAIADHNFMEPPSLLALEYIAYVTLFSTMRPQQRDEILKRYWYDAQWYAYADLLYLEDHLDFGAHAYWHYIRPENGPDFFRRLLSGEDTMPN